MAILTIILPRYPICDLDHSFVVSDLARIIGAHVCGYEAHRAIAPNAFLAIRNFAELCVVSPANHAASDASMLPGVTGSTDVRHDLNAGSNGIKRLRSRNLHLPRIALRRCGQRQRSEMLENQRASSNQSDIDEIRRRSKEAEGGYFVEKEKVLH